MKDRVNRVNVGNAAQAALLKHELLGQMSDGYWENSRGHGDDWRKWSRADVVVDPDNVGINFYQSRNYDFLSEDLLKTVRTRMILYVRLSERFSYEDTELLENLFNTISADRFCLAREAPEFTGIPEYMVAAAERNSDYHKAATERLTEILSSADDRNFLEKTCTLPIKTKVPGVHNLSALKKDLAALKAAQNNIDFSTWGKE